MILKKSCLALIISLISSSAFAQEANTIDSFPQLKTISLITPAILTSYGVSSFFLQPIRTIDTRWYNSINKQGVKQYRIDNFLQYTPAIAVYGLDMLGIKGKNNWKVQTVHLAIATIGMNVFVRPTKYLADRTRPDGSSTTSFPSGHTAEAFVNAEFLWQEYKLRNKWLAASGYVVAAATGYMRMQQNRHWFSDVVAGAGIGILSTKLTYWAYPRFVKLVKKKRSSKQ